MKTAYDLAWKAIGKGISDKASVEPLRLALALAVIKASEEHSEDTMVITAKAVATVMPVLMRAPTRAAPLVH